MSARPLLFAAAAALLPATAPSQALTQQSKADPKAVTFTVSLENVSTPTTLKLSTGASVAIPVSPVAWLVHSGKNPMFTPGEIEPGFGLKVLAEYGAGPAFAANIENRPGIISAGSPRIPVGEERPGMLLPGKRFEFTFTAKPGDLLSIATMIAQSNDGFISNGGVGIPLFDDNGRPLSGDITKHLSLWDAGTEVNEEPGFGPNQGLRQGAPHAGDPEREPVRPITESEFGKTWPSATQIIRVTVTPAVSGK